MTSFFNDSFSDFTPSVDTITEIDSPPTSSPPGPELTDFKFTEVIGYSILLILGGPTNIRVLYLLVRDRCYKRTRHHLLLLNLAIADCCVCCLMIPMEISWHVTNAWQLGELCCKLFQFIRVFGPYASSLVLICISVDRYYAVTDPFNYMSRETDSKIKKLLGLIWFLSAILSLPQVSVHL